MKDSGIEWIGEIPNHWKISKLKFHGDILVGLSFDKEDISEDNKGTLVLRSSNVQEGKISFLDNIFVKTPIPNKLRVKEGDILICSRNGSRRLIGKNCLLGKEAINMTWGVFMTVFRSTSSEFFFWVLNSQLFKSQSGLYLTSTINQLTVSTLENLVFPYVSEKEEQKLISQYLEKKTKNIDFLIGKIKKKIELLNEQKTALINQYVTKGLDPNVEMKDSGVNWIGDIPIDWQVRSIKSLIMNNDIEIQDGNHGELHPDPEEFINNGIPFIKPKDIQKEKINWEKSDKLPLKKTESFRVGFAFKNDILLVNRGGSIGKVCFVNNLDQHLPYFIINPQVTYIRSNRRIDPYFLYLIFNSNQIKCSIDLVLGHGSTFPFLGLSNMSYFKIVIPPIEVQKQISNKLKRIRDEISKKSILLTKKLDLLNEYRQSLISSVVTGKIRITEDMI